MPRPRSLLPSDIALAALRIVDHDGLGMLSMRTVATELGVGAMSLYRYVSDREALERLMVDHVLEPVHIRLEPDQGWTSRIRQLAAALYAAVSRHQPVAPLLMRHRHTSQEVQRCAETLLQALADGGFEGHQRVIALRMLVSYILGTLQAQDLGPLGGPGTAYMVDSALRGFPLLQDAARTARRIKPEEEFDDGLAIVIRGLETQPR